MASFGENIRREREMRGVTLQEISSATKIGVRFLQALEEEDFGRLPGGIFTRSFIRTYAKYLGLDEERVLAEYQLVAQPKADFDLTRLTAVRLAPARPRAWGPVLAALLAIVLIVGGYAVYRYSHRAVESGSAARPAAETPAPATTSPAAPPTSAAPGPETSAASPPAGSAASPAPESGSAGTAQTTPSAPQSAAAASAALPETAGGLVLQIAATEPSWVSIEADGKAVFQRVLTPSEIRTVHARESFDVTTGNALGIVLTLNGETLRPLGRRGEVKSVHLTLDDVKKTQP